MRQVKVSQSSLFLLRCHCFFLNKHSLNCCKPLVTFRVLKKLILTVLISILIVHMEEWMLGRPYSTISMDVIPPNLLFTQLPMKENLSNIYFL